MHECSLKQVGGKVDERNWERPKRIKKGKEKERGKSLKENGS